jgi:hypothetical protein
LADSEVNTVSDKAAIKLERARPHKKPPPFVPNEPKQKVPTEEDAEQIALENEEDTAPAEEDDTLIEEVDEDSPDMAGIVDAPEDNDKQ